PGARMTTEALRGRQFAVIEAVHLAGEPEGAELVWPLRALGPAMDTFALQPPAGIAEPHMDPPDPVPYLDEGLMLGQPHGAALDRFVAAAGPDSNATLLAAELRHVAGALHRAAPGHCALATLDASVLTFEVGMLVDEALRLAVRVDLDRLAAAVEP